MATAIDPTKARIEKELKHGSPLLGCRFDPSGRFLFASAQDFSIQRFDVATGEKTALAGHQSWCRGMAFAPAESSQTSTLISGDYHGKLLWWNAAEKAPKPTRTIAAHDGWIRAVAVSRDGQMVATCGNDKRVKLWSAAGKPLQQFAGHDSHVYNVAFHPDGTHLVSCDHAGIVKDWNLKTGQCERDLDAKELSLYDTRFNAHIGGARSMAFDAAHGKVRLAVSGITNVTNAFAGVGNPLVVLFDWSDGKPKLLKPKEAFQGTGWGLGFHPGDFVVLAAGGSGGRIFFWKGSETTSLHTVTVPIGARDLAIAPDGNRLAVAGANGTAYLYGFTPAPAAEKKPSKKPAKKK